MAGGLFQLLANVNEKQTIYSLGIGGELDKDVFEMMWVYFRATGPSYSKLAYFWVKFKDEFINSVRLIENRWKYLLVKRHKKRMIVNNEIQFIPKIGIKYIEALESFHFNSLKCK